MGRRLLYLVRHGQYQIHLRESGGLTDKGLAQSRLAGRALRMHTFDKLYCSPLPRAMQTADLIAEDLVGVPRLTDDALRECIPSIPDRYARYIAGSHPDLTGDRVSECADRLSAVYDQYFCPAPDDDDVHELIVSHGNVIRYMVARVLQMPDDGWSRMLIHNCGISRILIDTDGQAFLMSHNDIGHLPESMRTDN